MYTKALFQDLQKDLNAVLKVPAHEKLPKEAQPKEIDHSVLLNRPSITRQRRKSKAIYGINQHRDVSANKDTTVCTSSAQNREIKEICHDKLTSMRCKTQKEKIQNVKDTTLSSDFSEDGATFEEISETGSCSSEQTIMQTDSDLSDDEEREYDSEEENKLSLAEQSVKPESINRDLHEAEGKPLHESCNETGYHIYESSHQISNNIKDVLNNEAVKSTTERRVNNSLKKKQSTGDSTEHSVLEIHIDGENSCDESMQCENNKEPTNINAMIKSTHKVQQDDEITITSIGSDFSSNDSTDVTDETTKNMERCEQLAPACENDIENGINADIDVKKIPNIFPNDLFGRFSCQKIEFRGEIEISSDETKARLGKNMSNLSRLTSEEIFDKFGIVFVSDQESELSIQKSETDNYAFCKYETPKGGGDNKARVRKQSCCLVS